MIYSQYIFTPNWPKGLIMGHWPMMLEQMSLGHSPEM